MVVSPVVLQRANASTIHTALEKNITDLSTDGIKRFLECGKFCIISDIPDSCSANKRRQRKVAADLASEKHALYFAAGCAAHLVQRTICNTTREKKLIGHAHAIGFSLAIPGHRNRTRQALWQIIDSDPDIIQFVPPNLFVQLFFGQSTRRNASPSR